MSPTTTTTQKNKMRIALIIALVLIGMSPIWCAPVLKGIYHAVYKVEFGPKYVQMASRLSK
jgi:hypothetical protein